MKRRAYSQNRSRLAVSFILISIVLVPLGGCNTARGVARVFQGLGEDMEMATNGIQSKMAGENVQRNQSVTVNGLSNNANWSGR